MFVKTNKACVSDLLRTGPHIIIVLQCKEKFWNNDDDDDDDNNLGMTLIKKKL